MDFITPRFLLQESLIHSESNRPLGAQKPKTRHRNSQKPALPALAASVLRAKPGGIRPPIHELRALFAMTAFGISLSKLRSGMRRASSRQAEVDSVLSRQGIPASWR